MSHAGSWRAACNKTIVILPFHVGFPSVARGVTDPGVGSGALFGDAAAWIIGMEKVDLAVKSWETKVETADSEIPLNATLADSGPNMLPGLTATLDLELTSRRIARISPFLLATAAASEVWQS